MQNIIFLTDFSEPADNALEYLSHFLNTQPDCNVYLIHTFTLPPRTGMFMSVKERMREDARALLINRKRRLEITLEDRHFVFFKAIEGTLINVVEKLERQLKAELIVSAMRGGGTDDSNLIGPNAGSLITNTKVPLLLIPQEYEYKPLRNITLALKYPSIKSKKTVTVLTDLFNSPDTKLKVLLAKGSFTNEVSLRLEEYNYTLTESDQESLYESIMESQSHEKSDLIAVIRRDRGFFERFLKSGSFKRALLDIDVPLLVLRGAQ